MTAYQPTREILEAMLRKAGERLASARRDLEAGYYGDSASRAYYAAFHSVSAVLALHGRTFSSHAQTLGAFNREFVKTGLFPADSFRKLQRLLDDRHVADYSWNLTVERETAERDVADAESLVNACREYIEEGLRRSSPKE